MKTIFQLVRVGNLSIIGGAQYFTAFFLISHDTAWHLPLFLLVVSSIMIAMGGYIINDYFDIKIDLINKPERVMVGKHINRGHAIILHFGLSFIGVALGFLLKWEVGLINFFCALLLWFYSYNLKQRPFVGNIAIALLTFIAIAIVDMLYATFSPMVFIYALFAFTLTWIREIIKDMEDYQGDATWGYKTLPIVWGQQKTKMLLYVLIPLFGLSAALINQFYIGLPIYYFFVFLFIPLAYLFIRLVGATDARDFARLSKVCKIIVILGILSMALL